MKNNSGIQLCGKIRVSPQERERTCNPAFYLTSHSPLIISEQSVKDKLHCDYFTSNPSVLENRDNTMKTHHHPESF